MTLVLDTSVIIDIEQRKESTLQQLSTLASVHPMPAKITFVNEFEFLFGLKEKSPKNKEKAVIVLKKFGVLHTTKNTAEILSDLKYKYEKTGKTLPLADILIAALVIENNMVFVTKDRDFEHIEELKKNFLV